MPKFYFSQASCVELMDGHLPPSISDWIQFNAYFDVLHKRIADVYGYDESGFFDFFAQDYSDFPAYEDWLQERKRLDFVKRQQELLTHGDKQ